MSLVIFDPVRGVMQEKKLWKKVFKILYLLVVTFIDILTKPYGM